MTIKDGSNADMTGNYTITYTDNTASTINQKALTISGITAANKTYDGGTSATVSTTNAVYDGLLDSDQVSVSATGTFSDKNVATGKTVTLTSSYSGTDKANYSITDQSTTTANITPKSLAISGITAASKTYDSTPDAVVNAAGALHGKVNDDDLSLTSTGQFVDPQVGSDKVVNLTNTLAGDDLSNYVLDSQQLTAQASINPASTLEAPLVISQQTTRPPMFNPALPQSQNPTSDQDGDSTPSILVVAGAPQTGPLQVMVVNGGISLPDGLSN